MSITIRVETPEDHKTVYDLIETAFKTAKVADGNEQDFYATLKNSPRFIPDLALVAEENGHIAGQVMLTHFSVTRPDGTTHPSLLLAPIAVAENYRGKNVGASLIQESFNRARALGFDSIFLLGDPTYYSRFGFRPTVDFGILCKDDIPPHYIQAVELTPHALQNAAGMIDFNVLG